jgi:hypothetical protein
VCHAIFHVGTVLLKREREEVRLCHELQLYQVQPSLAIKNTETEEGLY